jgi:drug/metabolite transporter (DMT)-like permease
LDLKGTVILVILCASWGLNHAFMKLAYTDISPVLSSAVRSAVAGLCLWLWSLYRGYRLWEPGLSWIHAAAISLFFSVEFIFLYIGMDLTLASRGAVLLYTQPFFTALLAHLFVSGDRLNLSRSVGLCLAFAGVALILGGRPSSGQASLVGDLFCVVAGLCWGCTNVYIGRNLVGRAKFEQILFWQLAPSAPILALASLFLEKPFFRLTWAVSGNLLYQAVAVAFVSYLIWFSMFKRYKVSILGAFTFMAPIFGVVASWLIMSDPLTWGLLLGLAGVSVGVWLVNRG